MTRTRCPGRVIALAGLLAFSGRDAEARDLVSPAELPPADFAGQQYVDSKGCMFVRAGTGGQVLWIPRVSRVGKRMCDNPPSGGRVPVAEEDGIAEVPAAGPDADPAPGVSPAIDDAGTNNAATDTPSAGGVFVSIGSFADPANVETAEAALAQLGFGTIRGQLQGENSSLTTVFAGPFADANAAAKAREALRANGYPDAFVVVDP